MILLIHKNENENENKNKNKIYWYWNLQSILKFINILMYINNYIKIIIYLYLLFTLIDTN